MISAPREKESRTKRGVWSSSLSGVKWRGYKYAHQGEWSLPEGWEPNLSLKSQPWPVATQSLSFLLPLLIGLPSPPSEHQKPFQVSPQYREKFQGGENSSLGMKQALFHQLSGRTPAFVWRRSGDRKKVRWNPCYFLTSQGEARGGQILRWPGSSALLLRVALHWSHCAVLELLSCSSWPRLMSGKSLWSAENSV